VCYGWYFSILWGSIFFHNVFKIGVVFVVMDNKSLWEILVPRYTNERYEFSVDYHNRWDQYVRGIANGLTILRTAKGQWISPENELFCEEMIPVRVYCSREEIDKIVDFTLGYYVQKAVMAYEISSKVILKHNES
jgi:hypothetical protein